MSTCAYVEESTLKIKNENIDDALKLIYDYLKGGNKLRWVDEITLNEYIEQKNIKEDIDNCEECDIITIEEVFYELGLEISQDEEYLYINGLSRESLGDEDDMIELIAKYLEDGYMEMYESGGDRWRFVITGENFDVVYPKLSWD